MTRYTIGGLATAIGLGCLGLPAQAAPASIPVHDTAPVPLAAHTASYSLSLEATRGGGTIAATGEMSFKVVDACSAWASTQSLHLRMVTREGQSTDMVSNYATLESKDGHHLTFDISERDNGAVTQQVRGEASLEPGGGTIHFTLPARSTMALPAGTLFPMAHTAAIIQAAREGRRSIDPLLFDGTSADGPSDTHATILNWQPAPSDSPYPELAAQASGRVHVAFFARKPGTILPDYEVGMRYFADGVSDRLDMDFGDFTMAGHLRRFALAKPAKC